MYFAACTIIAQADKNPSTPMYAACAIFTALIQFVVWKDFPKKQTTQEIQEIQKQPQPMQEQLMLTLMKRKTKELIIVQWTMWTILSLCIVTNAYKHNQTIAAHSILGITIVYTLYKCIQLINAEQANTVECNAQLKND